MSSTKKPSSQKRADRERQDNRTLNRVYYVFLLGLAAECYLILAYRGFAFGNIGSTLAWNKFLNVAMWVGLALLAAGAVTAFVKKNDQKLRRIMTWVAGVGAFFFASSWIMTRFFTNGMGVTIMCVLVPILAVLALIYLLYQHECAVNTVLLGGAMFSVWLRGATAQSDYWRLPVIVGCVVVLLGLAAVAYLVHRARQDEGKLWGVRVFSPECDYRIVLAVVAAAAAGVLLVTVLPAISYYLMWVLGVLLFAELVYYTTKLM